MKSKNTQHFAHSSRRENRTDLSRRRFLYGTAGMLAGAAVVPTRPAMAQSTLTPEAALKELMDGNQRDAGGQLRSFDEDPSILKEKTAVKQEPLAAVLSCADSRVTVKVVAARYDISSGLGAMAEFG